MSQFNRLVTIINAQAEILKELNGEIKHKLLAGFTSKLVNEFKSYGLDLTDSAEQALFTVENLHEIAVD